MEGGRRQTPQNVILIGFMGSGKTSLGKRVARLLDFQFVDTDELVELAAEKPITRIFEEDGELAFREFETGALELALSDGQRVIATGGGIVKEPDNVEALRRGGLVVWLDLDADTILERVALNNERPLLQTEDPRATVEAMLAERRPLYEGAADQRVDSSGLDAGEMAYGIAESARVWFSRGS